MDNVKFSAIIGVVALILLIGFLGINIYQDSEDSKVKLFILTALANNFLFGGLLIYITTRYL